MGEETFLFFSNWINCFLSTQHPSIHPSIHPYGWMDGWMVCYSAAGPLWLWKVCDWFTNVILHNNMDGWMNGWMLCYSAAGPFWLWKVCDWFTTWFYITTLPEKKVREFKWLTSCDGVCLTQQNGSQYVIHDVAMWRPSFLPSLWSTACASFCVSHDLRTEKRRKSLYIKKNCGDGKE